MLFGRGGRQAGRSWVAGQVVGEAGHLLVGTRLREADARAELLKRQPALADRVTQ